MDSPAKDETKRGSHAGGAICNAEPHAAAEADRVADLMVEATKDVDLLYYPGAGEIEFDLPRREENPTSYVNPFDWTMYLIDTNVISELRKEKAGRADARVVNWARRAGVGQMFVAAHTLFELELGVVLLQRRALFRPLFCAVGCNRLS